MRARAVVSALARRGVLLLWHAVLFVARAAFDPCTALRRRGRAAAAQSPPPQQQQQKQGAALVVQTRARSLSVSSSAPADVLPDDVWLAFILPQLPVLEVFRMARLSKQLWRIVRGEYAQLIVGKVLDMCRTSADTALLWRQLAGPLPAHLVDAVDVCDGVRGARAGDAQAQAHGAARSSRSSRSSSVSLASSVSVASFVLASAPALPSAGWFGAPDALGSMTVWRRAEQGVRISLRSTVAAMRDGARYFVRLPLDICSLLVSTLRTLASGRSGAGASGGMDAYASAADVADRGGDHGLPRRLRSEWVTKLTIGLVAFCLYHMVMSPFPPSVVLMGTLLQTLHPVMSVHTFLGPLSMRKFVQWEIAYFWLIIYVGALAISWRAWVTVVGHALGFDHAHLVAVLDRIEDEHMELSFAAFDWVLIGMLNVLYYALVSARNPWHWSTRALLAVFPLASVFLGVLSNLLFYPMLIPFTWGMISNVFPRMLEIGSMRQQPAHGAWLTLLTMLTVFSAKVAFANVIPVVAARLSTRLVVAPASWRVGDMVWLALGSFFTAVSLSPMSLDGTWESLVGHRVSQFVNHLMSILYYSVLLVMLFHGVLFGAWSPEVVLVAVAGAAAHSFIRFFLTELPAERASSIVPAFVAERTAGRTAVFDAVSSLRSVDDCACRLSSNGAAQSVAQWVCAAALGSGMYRQLFRRFSALELAAFADVRESGDIPGSDELLHEAGEPDDSADLEVPLSPVPLCRRAGEERGLLTYDYADTVRTTLSWTSASERPPSVHVSGAVTMCGHIMFHRHTGVRLLSMGSAGWANGAHIVRVERVHNGCFLLYALAQDGLPSLHRATPQRLSVYRVHMDGSAWKPIAYQSLPVSGSVRASALLATHGCRVLVADAARTVTLVTVDDALQEAVSVIVRSHSKHATCGFLRGDCVLVGVRDGEQLLALRYPAPATVSCSAASGNSGDNGADGGIDVAGVSTAGDGALAGGASDASESPHAALDDDAAGYWGDDDVGLACAADAGRTSGIDDEASPPAGTVHADVSHGCTVLMATGLRHDSWRLAGILGVVGDALVVVGLSAAAGGFGRQDVSIDYIGLSDPRAASVRWALGLADAPAVAYDGRVSAVAAPAAPGAAGAATSTGPAHAGGRAPERAREPPPSPGVAVPAKTVSFRPGVSPLAPVLPVLPLKRVCTTESGRRSLHEPLVFGETLLGYNESMRVLCIVQRRGTDYYGEVCVWVVSHYALRALPGGHVTAELLGKPLLLGDQGMFSPRAHQVSIEPQATTVVFVEEESPHIVTLVDVFAEDIVCGTAANDAADTGRA